MAFEAVAVPRTVEYIFPNLSHVPLWTIAGFEVNLTWALVGALSAVVITWINLRGVKQASTVQVFVIVFLAIVGLMMVFGAFTRGSEQNMEPFFQDGVSGFFLVLVVVPFLFVGFDVIPQVSEEMHLPPKKLGGTIVTSVLIATVWYMMVILTTSSAMSAHDLANADIAVADAFGNLFNSGAMANVLLAGGLAGILMSWNSLLMGASRLLWALGNSRMLPR